MKTALIAYAAGRIAEAQGKRVTLYVVRWPEHANIDVTSQIPCGRTKFRMAGTYDGEITINELAGDLLAAERELSKQGRRQG